MITTRAFFYIALFLVTLGLRYFLTSGEYKSYGNSNKRSSIESHKNLISDKVRLKLSARDSKLFKDQNQEFKEEETASKSFDKSEKILSRDEQASLGNTLPRSAIKRDANNSIEVKNQVDSSEDLRGRRILNIVTPEFQELVKNSRSRDLSQSRRLSSFDSESGSSEDSDKVETEKKDCEVSIPNYWQPYRLFSFLPGSTYEGKKIKRPINSDFAINGPDYKFTPLKKSDPDYDCKLSNLRKRVLSLGNGGMVAIMVKGNKALTDGPEGDFVIYENGTPLYQEYAFVGVSIEFNKDIKWFSCNPKDKKSKLLGCAGVRNTSIGGDIFDLKDIGFTEAKFIYIKDTNLNFVPVPFRDPDATGFDLDAIKLINLETESEKIDAI